MKQLVAHRVAQIVVFGPLFGLAAVIVSLGITGRSTAKPVAAEPPLQDSRLIGEMAVDNVIVACHWRATEPAAPLKRIAEELAVQLRTYRYDWRAIRPEDNNPTEAQKPTDGFEIDLRQKWSKSNGEERFELRRDDRGQIFYKPVYLTTQNCLDCHRLYNDNKGLAKGDLQAIICVRIPPATRKKES